MFERNEKITSQEKPEGFGQEERQFEDPAMLLSCLIATITEPMILKIADAVGEQLRPLISELREFATKLQQVIYSQQATEKQLEALISQNRLLENASKESHLLSQDRYQQCIVEPMARSLFAVFDDIENAKRRCRETEHMDCPPVCDILDAIFIHLRQFLSVYQIEPVKHRPKSKFDPKVMRPVKIVVTENKDLDNRIAKSLQMGFRWQEDRLLRPESVTVFKYEDPLNNNFNEKERSRS